MTVPKRPRDPNQLAKSVIDIANGQKPDRDPTPASLALRKRPMHSTGSGLNRRAGFKTKGPHCFDVIGRLVSRPG